MKSKKTDNQKSEFYNVKFNPDPKIGLTQEQVNSRVNDGLTNKNVKHYTKSYWEIFKTNDNNYSYNQESNYNQLKYYLNIFANS